MFHINAVQKIKAHTHSMIKHFFPKIFAVYKMCKNITQPDRPEMTLLPMRARYLRLHTNT